MSVPCTNTCLDLMFEFPDGCRYWDMDLEHIRTKIMTHRSNYSREIDVDASCYYEAAKTMLGILNLFYISGRLSNPFSYIRIIITPDKIDGIPHVSLYATAQLAKVARTSELMREHTVQIKMVYTNAKSVNDENGLFTISVALMDKPGGDIQVSEVLGNPGILLAEHVQKDSPAWAYLLPNGDDSCWPSECVLKYSENFPAPSVMIGRINETFRSLIRRLIAKEEKVAADAADGADNGVLQPATCVAGWTKVLTAEGEQEIRTLVGKPVQAWNGQVYSDVIVEELNCTDPLLIVTFQDKKQLFVTNDHTFIMATGARKRADELQPGDVLAAWVRPDGLADVVAVAEIQEGPVIGVVYHVQDPLQHKAMYNGIITIN